MTVATYIGLVFGYLTSALWCLRWVPTLIYHVRHRKYMEVNNSFIIIEGLACVCGIIYGYLDGLMPIIITNGLGLFTTVVVLINNKCYALKAEETG